MLHDTELFGSWAAAMEGSVPTSYGHGGHELPGRLWRYGMTSWGMLMLWHDLSGDADVPTGYSGKG